MNGKQMAKQPAVTAHHSDYYSATNMAFAGSLITRGSCRGIVVASGEQTRLAGFARVTKSSRGCMAPLGQDLYRFVFVVVCASLLLTVVNVVWLVAYVRQTNSSRVTAVKLITTVASSMTVLVPKALPLSIACGLFATAVRLARKRVFVKHLFDAESFSGVNVLVCDKTGTLTLNRMHVATLIVGMEKHDVRHMRRHVRQRVATMDGFKQMVSRHLLNYNMFAIWY
jgi:P-type E1-E2 ATPase